ncbi:hypothetical protein [Candidatus Villigracilis affinis]|uniref:hypothetical protein n=1 Tax=Candidatus Villigracilis affinis TaxID=3140682 RepID=UPI002A21E8D5|nr:hypothetical protein [Anaerolineales bacterium]
MYKKVGMFVSCRFFKNDDANATREISAWATRGYIAELLDDEVVDGAKVGGGESEFGEQQIDAIHPEGEFVSVAW